jgi:hypothetical protein
VDDPRGFAVRNASDDAVTVSFHYDPVARIMTVEVEGKPRATQFSPELGGDDSGQIAGGQA